MKPCETFYPLVGLNIDHLWRYIIVRLSHTHIEPFNGLQKFNQQ
jgi:hypothetical protein